MAEYIRVPRGVLAELAALIVDFQHMDVQLPLSPSILVQINEKLAELQRVIDPAFLNSEKERLVEEIEIYQRLRSSQISDSQRVEASARKAEAKQLMPSYTIFVEGEK